MHGGNIKSTTNQHSISTIQKLRADVLKQAEASLSALIGKVNFSDTFAAATLVQTGVAPVPVVVGTSSNEDGNTRGPIAPPARNEHENLLFNDDKLHDAVSHANDMTKRYGVGVLSINIISARPRSEDLMQSLAKGAVAAAEAQQLEITARGRAKAAIIMAKGEADAEVTRADGSKMAASLLQEEAVAVQLAYINSTGEALSKAGSTLILGNHASGMPGGLQAEEGGVVIWMTSPRWSGADDRGI